MERLTARSNSDIAAPKELVQNGCAEMCSYLCEVYLKRGDNVCEDCPVQKCFEKLAEYEDTGLSPEKIMMLIEDYEVLSKECDYALEEINLWRESVFEEE